MLLHPECRRGYAPQLGRVYGRSAIRGLSEPGNVETLLADRRRTAAAVAACTPPRAAGRPRRRAPRNFLRAPLLAADRHLGVDAKSRRSRGRRRAVTAA